jgi:hypothetical protein
VRMCQKDHIQSRIHRRFPQLQAARNHFHLPVAGVIKNLMAGFTGQVPVVLVPKRDKKLSEDSHIKWPWAPHSWSLWHH